MPFSDELVFLTRQLHLKMERRIQALRWKPPADVYRSRDGWLIKLDLAGVRQEDIKVNINGNFLSVSGRRVDLAREAGFQLQSLEIAYGEFERVFEFPVSIEGARFLTDFRNGMLLVRILSGE